MDADVHWGQVPLCIACVCALGVRIGDRYETTCAHWGQVCALGTGTSVHCVRIGDRCALGTGTTVHYVRVRIGDMRIGDRYHCALDDAHLCVRIGDRYKTTEKVPNCVILNITKWNEESLMY